MLSCGTCALISVSAWGDREKPVIAILAGLSGHG